MYAKDVSRPLVFTVDKTLADDLKKSPADYRLKDIFDFREFTGATPGHIRPIALELAGAD